MAATQRSTAVPWRFDLMRGGRAVHHMGNLDWRKARRRGWKQRRSAGNGR